MCVEVSFGTCVIDRAHAPRRPAAVGTPAHCIGAGSFSAIFHFAARPPTGGQAGSEAGQGLAYNKNAASASLPCRRSVREEAHQT